MLKSYQLQQRAADHDIYAKIMEQWIQFNYIALKKFIHLPVHNNYMHELKSTSTTVLQRGIQTTIATLYVQFDHHSSMASHATSTNNASYLNVTTTS